MAKLFSKLLYSSSVSRVMAKSRAPLPGTQLRGFSCALFCFSFRWILFIQKSTCGDVNVVCGENKRGPISNLKKQVSPLQTPSLRRAEPSRAPGCGTAGALLSFPPSALKAGSPPPRCAWLEAQLGITAVTGQKA